MCMSLLKKFAQNSNLGSGVTEVELPFVLFCFLRLVKRFRCLNWSFLIHDSKLKS